MGTLFTMSSDLEGSAASPAPKKAPSKRAPKRAVPDSSLAAAPTQGAKKVSPTQAEVTAAKKEEAKRKAKRPAKKANKDAMPVGSLAKLPSKISPSRAKDFMQCPKLFYYKTILGLKTPNTVHTARGTLAHSAFEMIFDHPKGDRTPENAVAYVRPAWRAMLNPLPDRSEVEPGSPEDRLRIAYKSYRDLTEEGSWAEGKLLADAADYNDLCKRDAIASQSTSEPKTAEELEEELLTSAELMVTNWFDMENPEKFDPTARELHVQATALGVTMHGYIDRLDRVVMPDGSTKVFISDYKAAWVMEPLATPSGWTTMGEVQVGDLVMGSDGRPTKVLGKSEVFHDRPCFRVEFDDKTSVVTDAEHLWQVSYGQRRKAPARGWVKTEVMTTEQLAAFKARGQYPVWIENAAPLVLPEAELPLDPYVLGAWLGDGNTRHAYFHAHEQDLAHFTAEFEARGETVIDVPHEKENKRRMHRLRLGTRNAGLCRYGHVKSKKVCRSCRTGPKGLYPVASPLASRLRHLGVLGNKHVPAAYLRGSKEQRLLLLQGLMDTDGSWNETRQQAVFTTTLPALADAVQELVHSLGMRTGRFERDYVNGDGSGRTAYQVMFTPVGVNPFRLARKAQGVPAEASRKSQRRSISAVVPVESVPTQCIKVDAPDSLFLVGRQMVPTHNTGTVPGSKKKYAPHVQARIDDESFFAMRVYALLYWEMHKVVPHQLRLIYVKTGDRFKGIKTQNVTPEMLNQTRREMSALWKNIKDSARREVWEPKTGPLCNWCTFQDVCPAFNDGIDQLLPETIELRGEGVVDDSELLTPPAAAIAENDGYSEGVTGVEPAAPPAVAAAEAELPPLASSRDVSERDRS